MKAFSWLKSKKESEKGTQPKAGGWFCTECGHKNTAGAKFCAECGNKRG